jgi:adenylosuccinate synthase
MAAHLVIGLNYGDEGKGLVTDYLASKLHNPIVVRANGGAQAGHTVVYNNFRHVFNHIGSGYFASVDTYLAEDFVLNPILFRMERERLYEETKLGSFSTPVVYAHPGCIITTPWDMIANQKEEESREERHGSCGVGVWTTIDRNSRSPFTFSNLLSATDMDIDLWIESVCEDYDVVPDQNVVDHFKADLEFFCKNVRAEYYDKLDHYSNLIFEGAQGLMLDQNYGEYPNVTPSNTGVNNPVDVLKCMRHPKKLTIHYVTRAYLTRHGNGKLKNEYSDVEYADNTNITNAYQGSLRFAPIHLRQISQAIVWQDMKIQDAGFTRDNNFYITHMDQMDDMIPFEYGLIPKEQFPNTFLEKIGCSHDRVFVSDGPTRKNIRK